MNLPSDNHPAGTGAPGGFLRAISRWVVAHTGLVTLVLVLLVAASCVGQWWLALHHAQAWDASHRGEPVPFRLFATAGWMLILGTGSWLGFWTLSGFDMRKRQRIFESRPIHLRLLWIYGLFGLLGFALGMALALRLAAAAAWQDEILSRYKWPLGLVVLAIFVMAMAVGRIRDVLLLYHCDRFAGARARALAQAVAEEEQSESDEAEREHERKSVTGWPYVVFVGGSVGGLFLANRWLPEADGNTASQAIVSGLIGSVAAMYLLQTKPCHWQVWLGMALAVAVGFLVFTHVSWHCSPVYLLLGTLWGIAVGGTSTMRYLRKLRRDSTPDMEKETRNL